MKTLKKILKGFLIFLIVLVVLLIIAIFSLGSIIKASVETIGPVLTKTTMTMGSCWFYPIRADLEINDFVLGNPQGFSSEYAFKFNAINIDVDQETLFDDLIVVNKVVIDGISLCLDQPLSGKSNIEVIIDNIEKSTQALASPTSDTNEDDTQKDDDSDETESSKKVLIKEVIIQNGSLIPAISGLGVKFPLPTIVIRDIGGKGDDAEGATPAEAIKAILDNLLKSSANLSTQALKDAGNALKNAGDSALQNLSETGKNTTESLKNVGEKTTESLKDAGKEAEKSLKELGTGIKNIF